MFTLTEEQDQTLKEVPESLWSKGKADVGLINVFQPIEITAKSTFRPHQRQYPLKPDAEEGIDPIIRDLLKAGVIIQYPALSC